MDTVQVTFLARVILYGIIGTYMIWRCYLRLKTGGDKLLAVFLFMAGAPLMFLTGVYELVILGVIGPNAFMQYTGWVGLVSFSGFYLAIVRGKL